ncbi:WD40-repeat-containing domain protein [Xylariaceae sp. FL0594]|nr:WD40-repeat-containing domain protein [Xylariaceae sp. FL0594]
MERHTWVFINYLRGHRETVGGLDISPDGKQIVSASSDCTARIWDLATAFSPDGSLIATSSWDTTARVWEAKGERQNEVTKLIAHTAVVRKIAFSRDGKYIVTCSRDATARIWDAITGRPVTKLVGHTKDVKDVSFHPKLDLLASVSIDDTVKIWEYRFGGLIATWAGQSGFLITGSFSPDGNILATSGDDRNIKLWNVTDFFDNMLASAALDGTVRLWGVHTGFLIRTFTLGGHLFSVVFSKDQELIACSGDSGKVILIETGPDLKTLKSLSKYARTWDEVDGGEPPKALEAAKWLIERRKTQNCAGNSTPSSTTTAHPNSRPLSIRSVAALHNVSPTSLFTELKALEAGKPSSRSGRRVGRPEALTEAEDKAITLFAGLRVRSGRSPTRAMTKQAIDDL